MEQKILTLDRFIIEQERKFPGATGAFTGLIQNIAFAAKVISREVNKAGLVNILGLTGTTNVQGEKVQKLDVYTRNVIYNALDHTGLLSVMATEEDDDIVPIPEKFPAGKYVALFDPLDGSSNIDANVSIGTIFAIHRKISSAPRGTREDCLQRGRDLVCAGYVVYGSSTMLVYSTGNGVHGFTLDPSIGEFLLSHEDIRIPKQGKYYSANEGNYLYWKPGTRKFIDYLKAPDNHLGKPFSLRYIGSLVADFHRNLLYGGVFLYPEDSKNPAKPNGKLRLLYECAPLSFLAEHAGGYASTGTGPILDIEPADLHQRVPLVIGSEYDVRLYEKFCREER